MCVLSVLNGSTPSALACVDFDARVVDASSLTCSIANETIALGQAVTVNGVLTPQAADTIGLLYQPPIGDGVSVNTTTAGNGAYSNSFTPTIPGVWNVMASWVGDDKHAPTDSPLCRFVVEEKPESPIFKAKSPANCREGISILWQAFGITSPGQEYPVMGVSTDLSWLMLQLDQLTQCWVKADTGDVSGDLGGARKIIVPIITATPTLIPSPTPTSEPKFNCSSVTNESYCKEKYASICEWVVPPIGGDGHCVNK
jgi:hypothetical protein